MEKLTADSPETQSADLVADNIDQLRNLFPEAFTEGKIDFEVLKQLLGGAVDEREEKYGLNWHGKRRARQLALTPSTGTLRPCPEDSVNWDTTQNLMIEGDNLEVLKLLQKSYAGKVKLIYIDPPYNTGKDFVYPDDFRDNIKNYLELTGQVEGGKKINSNTEVSGRFHTDWLNMMYPRLKLARNLLQENGVIFVSIDDSELGNLQTILTDIFGEENFQANISWQKRYTRSNNTVDFTTVVEHILVYSKSEDFIVNLLERTKEADDRYSNPDNDSRGPWKGASFLNPATPQQRPNLCYPIRNPNTDQITNPSTNAWRRSRQEFERLQADGRLYWGADGKQPLPAIKMFLAEARNITPINFWEHGYAGNTDDGTRNLRETLGEKVFDNPKPVQLIKRVIEHGSDPSSIVLDFFSGSGTTGHAVMAQNTADDGNRRYILVQLPEPLDPENKDQKTAADFCDQLSKPRNIAELTKERLRRATAKIKSDPQIAQIDADKENARHKDIFEDNLRESASSVHKPVLDLGFRVFKLDSSNIHAWEPNRDNLAQSLFDATEHLKDDRTEQDILFELLLKLGLELTVPIETKLIHPQMTQMDTDKSKALSENHLRESASSADKYSVDKAFTVHSIGAGVLLVCLSDHINNAEVEPLGLGIVEWHKQLSPAGETQLVFRDSAFADDVAKTNLTAILQQHGLENVRSL